MAQTAVDVKVEVSEAQTPEGYVYRYRVSNHSSSAVASLYLGYSRITGDAELQTAPTAIHAPQGWDGSSEGGEGLSGIAVVWGLSDRFDTAHEIAPGSAMDGFEVVLPRASPEYRKAVFTAYLRNTAHDVGNVRPLVPDTDLVTPNVSIAEPAAGTVVGGMTRVSAQAADNVGVLDVRFKLDGRDLGSGPDNPPLTSPPYTLPWNTLYEEDGSHVLTAIARDAVGNEATASITVTVANHRTMPTVQLISPTAGSMLSGAVTLTASPSAAHGVLGVYFQVDGRQVGPQANTPPYSITWDSSTVPDGSHDLAVAVLDATGAVVVSDRVRVEVRNRSDSTPPTLRVGAAPSSLWPPNHKLVPVSVSLTVSDDTDPHPTVKLVSITCDDDCNPAQDVAGATFNTDDRGFEVRSERTGTGSGRTYTITYSAEDASGNRATATTTVTVPHDQAQK
jgi:hypothetical protein